MLARVEAGEEGLCAEKAFEFRPCALRGIALPVEEGEIPPKIAEPRVEFALFYFLAAEFFGKAGVEAGNGGVLCDLFGRKRTAELFRLPPAELAQEMHVPVVFNELVHALFALLLFHIVVDEGMEGAVRRVVGDIAEDIGKGARAVLVRIDGEAGVLFAREDAAEEAEHVVRAVSVQKFSEVIFAAAADAVEKEHIGPLTAEEIFVGGALDDVLQPFGEEFLRLFGDKLMGDGGWHKFSFLFVMVSGVWGDLLGVICPREQICGNFPARRVNSRRLIGRCCPTGEVLSEPLACENIFAGVFLESRVNSYCLTGRCCPTGEGVSKPPLSARTSLREFSMKAE